MATEIKTDIQLKVCPFCGGRAALYHEKLIDSPYCYEYYVGCSNYPECSIEPKTSRRYDSYYPKEQCIKMVTSMWNKRAEDSSPRNSIVELFKHGCKTCKYRHESVLDEPCYACEPGSDTKSNWEFDIRKLIFREPIGKDDLK